MDRGQKEREGKEVWGWRPRGRVEGGVGMEKGGGMGADSDSSGDGGRRSRGPRQSAGNGRMGRGDANEGMG